MHLAIISDIHGNLEALLRVFDRIETEHVDDVVCLGDVVGYGPFPDECITLVRERCAYVIRGNHDAGAVGEEDPGHFSPDGRTALEWTTHQLSNDNVEFLRSLSLTVVVGSLTAVHSSPFKPEAWTYLSGWSQAREAFTCFATQFCAFGHTHVPVVVAEDGSVNTVHPEKKLLLNPGSVGQPRDGNPRASFALLDTDAMSASIIRVRYDVETTVQSMRKAGLPEPLARRLIPGI